MTAYDVGLSLETRNAPAAELRDVQWIEPEVVVQVRFQRWTEDSRLWHPSLVAVREDKPAGKGRREATLNVSGKSRLTL